MPPPVAEHAADPGRDPAEPTAPLEMAPEPAYVDPSTPSSGEVDPGAGESAAVEPALARRPRLRIPAVASLALALLLLVGALAWRQHAASTVDSRQAGRVAAVAEAKRAAVDLLSVNHTKLADNKKKALAHLAPKFKGEYDRFFTDLETTARKNKLVLSADVVGAGTVRMPDGDHAVVLLFVDQVSTNAVRATPRIDQNRVRMRLVRSGDRWLVEGIDAI